MCNSCPDVYDADFDRYADYDPADAYYDEEQERLWEEEQAALEAAEADLLPEGHDESTLTDAQWAALDAQQIANQFDPPQPPAWMQEMWAELDAPAF